MTGRIYRAQLTDAPTAPKGRIYRAQFSGSLPAAPKGRIYNAQFSGTAGVTVNALAPLTNVEPESTVALSASLVDGSTPDSWAWRSVSGPAVGIVGTGATVTIAAPSDINGATVVVGVRASKSGVLSPEVTCSISVLPQTEWLWADTGWVPHVETWS